jgi:hypothetical protein
MAHTAPAGTADSRPFGCIETQPVVTCKRLLPASSTSRVSTPHVSATPDVFTKSFGGAEIRASVDPRQLEPVFAVTGLRPNREHINLDISDVGYVEFCARVGIRSSH